MDPPSRSSVGLPWLHALRLGAEAIFVSLLPPTSVLLVLCFLALPLGRSFLRRCVRVAMGRSTEPRLSTPQALLISRRMAILGRSDCLDEYNRTRGDHVSVCDAVGILDTGDLLWSFSATRTLLPRTRLAVLVGLEASSDDWSDFVRHLSSARTITHGIDSIRTGFPPQGTDTHIRWISVDSSGSNLLAVFGNARHSIRPALQVRKVLG